MLKNINFKLMKTTFVILLLSTIFFGGVLQDSKNPVVLIKTEFGNIEVEIFQDKAPISASNFLRYVDNGFYKNSSFYRTVTLNNQPKDEIKIDVIQGGLFDKDNIYPPIKHETTKETGILHKDGTISFARNEPGTATSEFFICIGDQPELDYGGKRNPDRQGFAAFGRVISGMDIVRKINNRHANGQMLHPQIKIYNIERKKQG
jgi:peptidyl-prolyl cis-trans isomerase A (cyclophilin A)